MKAGTPTGLRIDGGVSLMAASAVALVRYEKPLESVRNAIELSGALERLPRGAKVFVKPNIVFWTRATAFPKWGVVTTSRVVEDMVVLLKERGVGGITIGEGTVVYDPKDTRTPAHAFESLGYGTLARRYGVKVVNVFERPFEPLDLGDGVTLNFNVDYLGSDFLVDLPVLKTHAQTVVSLGIKNVKGLIDIPSRKKCHRADSRKDLHYMVAKLLKSFPASCTLIDGIFSIERGPMYDGKARRSNVLAASADPLAADMVGAMLLGYEPQEVPHLLHAARQQGRSLDVSEIEIRGEKVEDLASRHEYFFPYNEQGSLPLPMEQMGIEGLSYRRYDLTICTYCSQVNGLTLAAIARAWKGIPWDNVEVLTGKVMAPSPGMKKTILLGACMSKAHKGFRGADQVIEVKGCPPSPEAIGRALREAGIEVDLDLFRLKDAFPGRFTKRYENNPEFDESFFSVV
jgi:uncharacterized protein (DUF362 family)